MTTDGKLSRNSVLEGGSRVRGTPSHYPPAQPMVHLEPSYSAQMNDRMASRSMNDQMASHSVPMAHSCTQKKPYIERERESSWRMPVTSLAGARDQPLPVTSWLLPVTSPPVPVTSHLSWQNNVTCSARY